MTLPTEDGLYPGLTREEYDAIDRVNWSTLKHMKRSPAHYLAAKMGSIKKDSDALRVGSATHLAVLEPERYRSTVAVWEGKRRDGKVWDEFETANAGKIILTQEQHANVSAMAEAARTDEHAGPFLRGGTAEVTVLWTWDGVQCKGRIDFATDSRAIVDLKTTKNASPEDFGKTAYNLDYLGQAAFYSQGFALATKGEVLPYVLVALESETPHLAQVYGLPDFLVDAAEQQVRGYLQRLVRCRKENRWPGYANGVLDLELPRWAKTG